MTLLSYSRLAQIRTMAPIRHFPFSPFLGLYLPHRVVWPGPTALPHLSRSAFMIIFTGARVFGVVYSAPNARPV